jgi:hypothetical protein
MDTECDLFLGRCFSEFDRNIPAFNIPVSLSRSEDGAAVLLLTVQRHCRTWGWRMAQDGEAEGAMYRVWCPLSVRV